MYIFFLEVYDYENIWHDVFFCFCRIDMETKGEKKPETDEKFWELLMSADKKDYESICAQYGVKDFRGMLKKLSEKKIEREQEQEKVSFT